MAEFVQTMKDWRRMCQHMDKEYGNSCCDKCPLGGCSAVYEMCGKENFTNMERDISAWAAEHPEPVYPTWAEYLMHIYQDVSYARILGETIPADIAQKLWLRPKEVDHGT